MDLRKLLGHAVRANDLDTGAFQEGDQLRVTRLVRTAQCDLPDAHRMHGTDRGRRGRSAWLPRRILDRLDETDVRAWAAVGHHRGAVDAEVLCAVLREEFGAVDQAGECRLSLGVGLVTLAQRGKQEPVAVRDESVEVYRRRMEHAVRVDPTD